MELELRACRGERREDGKASERSGALPFMDDGATVYLSPFQR